jgi:hypothetical protein
MAERQPLLDRDFEICGRRGSAFRDMRTPAIYGLRSGPPLPAGSLRALALRGIAMLAGLMPAIGRRRRGWGYSRDERDLRSFSCLPAGGRGGAAAAAAGAWTPADAGLALGRDGAPAAAPGG